MGAHSSCLPCLPARHVAHYRRSNSVSTRLSASRTSEVGRTGSVGAKDGGFLVEVRAVAGLSWRIEGLLASHTTRELKSRLAERSWRFKVYNTDLVFGQQVLSDRESLGSAGVGPGCRVTAVFSDLKVAALIIGGGVGGRTAVKELSATFQDQLIVLVDPQEYSENAAAIFRAYVDPATWDPLTFEEDEFLDYYPNVQFLQAEVTQIRPGSATAVSSLGGAVFTIRFEYCLVAVGCGSGPRSGESLWRPAPLGFTRPISAETPSLDERQVAGRRQTILEEHRRLWALHDDGGDVLVVGADYQGVEWACDLRHFFPNLRVTLIDHLHRCLGTLPTAAALYAEQYMQANGIRTIYEVKYEPDRQEFWDRIDMPHHPDVTYFLGCVSPRNDFMPNGVVSARGPGGGGWITINEHLQVCARKGGDRPAQVWGGGRVFAVGDCQYGAVVAHKNARPPTARDADDLFDRFSIPPVPKTAFAAASWAKVACRNIALNVAGRTPEEATWPTEAGIFPVGLGPNDGVVAWKVRWTRDSGEVLLTGPQAAWMKRRLVWPEDRSVLADPGRWLGIFQEGLPASWRNLERGRSVLRTSDRAW